MPELAPNPTAVTRNLHRNQGELRGDSLLRGHGTDCIIDVRVTGTDAKSNLSQDPAKVLESHEQEKKRKYLASCIAQLRRHIISLHSRSFHRRPLRQGSEVLAEEALYSLG
jgi:hypothetical protein